MTKHQHTFLKFEAVLAHCEARVPEGSLFAAMDYGREMEFFDENNNLLIIRESDGSYTVYQDSVGYTIFGLYAKNIWGQASAPSTPKVEK